MRILTYTFLYQTFYRALIRVNIVYQNWYTSIKIFLSLIPSKVRFLQAASDGSVFNQGSGTPKSKNV